MKYYVDQSRHLICFPYSIENLHIMANELGIKKCWFHSKSKSNSMSHYDVPKRRIKEITNKCTIVDTKTLIQIIKNNFIPEI